MMETFTFPDKKDKSPEREKKKKDKDMKVNYSQICSLLPSMYSLFSGYLKCAVEIAWKELLTSDSKHTQDLRDEVLVGLINTLTTTKEEGEFLEDLNEESEDDMDVDEESSESASEDTDDDSDQDKKEKKPDKEEAVKQSVANPGKLDDKFSLTENQFKDIMVEDDEVMKVLTEKTDQEMDITNAQDKQKLDKMNELEFAINKGRYLDLLDIYYTSVERKLRDKEEDSKNPENSEGMLKQMIQD